MYRLFYISSLISLTFGYLPIIPVKNYNKNFKKQEVQIYEPYELKKNETDAVVFFTGANSIIPGFVYGNFLNRLAETNLSVYVSINNDEVAEEITDYLTDNYKSVSVVSHSTGAINALKTCNLNKNIKKCVLMDPVDNRFLDNFWSAQKKLQTKNLDSLLFLNAKLSYEWNLMPLSIPFIPAFDINKKDIDENACKIKIIEAKEYGHSDILDYLWANLMDSTISKGNENRDSQNLNNYHTWNANIIKTYINDLKIDNLKQTIKNVVSSHSELNNIKYKFK